VESAEDGFFVVNYEFLFIIGFWLEIRKHLCYTVHC